jgi:hypothetical protein
MKINNSGGWGKLLILTVLAYSSTSLSAYAASEISSDSSFAKRKIKKLDAELTQLEDSARSGRHWGGGILIGIGGVSAIGALATLGNDRSEVPIVLGVSAGLFGGLGALVLASPSDLETLPPKFREMPESNASTQTEKVDLGESYLTQFAHSGKNSRIIGGFTNLALGGALIGWYLSEKNTTYISSTYGYSYSSTTSNPYLLYDGILIAALGACNFFIQTPQERALQDYDSWKSSESNAHALVKFKQFNVAMTPAGGMGTLTWSF